MRTKELHGVAQNLAAMSCSEGRIGSDFELLAALPDGEVSFNLITGSAVHSVAGAIAPLATQSLMSWLRDAKVPQLDVAQISLHIDTSNPPTHRETLVSFRFKSVATLAAGTRTYIGQATNHLWHNRPAQQAAQRDVPASGQSSS